MKQYFKYINEQLVIRTPNNIIVVADGMQTINPTEEMILNDGWEEYVAPEPEPIDELVLAKENMVSLINKYDSSENVNVFYVNDMPMWLDKATRVGLRLRFESELGSGMSDTVLWYEDMPFPLKIENAIQMLHAIELYASKCYDNTKQHIYNVKQLEDVELVKNYDYKANYPEVLKF